MNDDYLWDRSGKPDPEIQQLEEILGTLRYQPKPLEIPAGIQPGHKRFVSGWAIAASIALVVLGLGVWLGFQRQQTPQKAAASPVDEKKLNGLFAGVNGVSSQPQPNEPVNEVAAEVVVVKNRTRPRHAAVRSEKSLPASEVAEGRAAKDELMFALRFASSKLSLVQKKTQGANIVHNQHKIG